MSHLANGWADRGVEATLLTFDTTGESVYPLDERVRRVNVETVDSAIPPVRVWDRVAGLRKQLRGLQPDAIVSFVDRTNVQTLLAARGLGIPVIVSERIDPRMGRLGSGWSMLRRWAYPSASMLVVQTRTVQRWAARRFPGLATTLIPNPIVLPPVGRPQRDKFVLAAGRLVPQKGFDVLIRAFASIAPRHPEWRLEIAGEGEERAALQQLVGRLGMQERIELAGFRPDLAARHQAAGLFVLPSRFEGFPNVLVEAMSHGTAVIAANCRSGPSEIVHDQIDGRLVAVDDVEQLSQVMSALIADPLRRFDLGRAARAATERFRLTHVLDMWEETLERCLAKGRSSGGQAHDRVAA